MFYRFCPEVSKDDAWVSARSHESYAKNYSIIFPHDEPLAGRNMKQVGCFEHTHTRICARCLEKTLPS